MLPLEWKGSSTSIGMELQMRIIGVAAAIALAAMGAAATAQEAQPEAEQEKKICRTSKMTGSLASRTRKGLEEMGQSASGGQAVANNQNAAGS